jgi:alkylation response protein AidB-like acyl-CoA dehydrogenase
MRRASVQAAGRVRAVALDFTLPPELRDLIDRVRADGRLAHAMRWIGAAQRALDLSSARLLTRKAFGKELARHRGLQFMLAASAMDLPIARIFQDACAARIYDGASEVHRMVVARDMLELALRGESVRAACGAH